MDLYVLDRTMTGQKYHENLRILLCRILITIVLQQDRYSWTIMLDDTWHVLLLNITIDTIPRPVMSPDMNPIEHLWDHFGRKIYNRVPASQNLYEFRDALVEERQIIPLRPLHRLVQTMPRRVDKLFSHYYGVLTPLNQLWKNL